MENLILSLFFGFILIAVICCDGGQVVEKVNYNKLESISATAWKELSEKKIYFGHQSVGENIINGFSQITNDNPFIRLSLVETYKIDDVHKGNLAHSKVGRNKKPLSKISEFAEHINGGLGDKVDIAFFKFCYIDINAETDVKALFETYRESMQTLRINYKSTQFVHVTVPLKVVQKGPRAFVKRLIGRPIGGYKDNIKRNQFNDMLREEYVQNEPIYDLANIESTYPDGNRMIFKDKGKQYFSLVPEYSYDGRHLNEQGGGKGCRAVTNLAG